MSFELRERGPRASRLCGVPPTTQGAPRTPAPASTEPRPLLSPSSAGARALASPGPARPDAPLRPPCRAERPLTCRAPGSEGGKRRPSPPGHVHAPPQRARDLVPKGHESSPGGQTPGGAASQPLGVPPLAPETGPGAGTRLSHFPTRFRRGGGGGRTLRALAPAAHGILSPSSRDPVQTLLSPRSPSEMRACAAPGPRPQSWSEAGPAPGPRTVEWLGGLRRKSGANPGASFSHGAGAVTLTTSARRGRPGAPSLPRAARRRK